MLSKATLSHLFTEHPRDVGESYSEHAAIAAGFGATMIAGGLACLVHAIVPGLYVRTASDTVRRLNARLGPRGRSVHPAPEPVGGWSYEI